MLTMIWEAFGSPSWCAIWCHSFLPQMRLVPCLVPIPKGSAGLGASCHCVPWHTHTEYPAPSIPARRCSDSRMNGRCLTQPRSAQIGEASNVTFNVKMTGPQQPAAKPHPAVVGPCRLARYRASATLYNAQDCKGNGDEYTAYQCPIQISEKSAAVHVALIGELLRHERREERNEISGYPRKTTPAVPQHRNEVESRAQAKEDARHERRDCEKTETQHEITLHCCPLKLEATGAQQTLRRGNLPLCVRVGRPTKPRHVNPSRTSAMDAHTWDRAYVTLRVQCLQHGKPGNKHHHLESVRILEVSKAVMQSHRRSPRSHQLAANLGRLKSFCSTEWSRSSLRVSAESCRQSSL